MVLKITIILFLSSNVFAADVIESNIVYTKKSPTEIEVKKDISMVEKDKIEIVSLDSLYQNKDIILKRLDEIQAETIDLNKKIDYIDTLIVQAKNNDIHTTAYINLKNKIDYYEEQISFLESQPSAPESVIEIIETQQAVVVLKQKLQEMSDAGK